MAMVNPYDDKKNELVNRMMQQTTQQPSQMYLPAQYGGFNSATNQSYQAALRDAGRNAQTASNNSMVQIGSKGVGNSSMVTDRVGQIHHNAMGRVSDTLLPQYEQMDYNRHRDFVGDQFRVNDTNYNRSQDQYRNTNDLARFMSDLSQRGQDNARADAALTGHYMPDGTQGIIDRIMNNMKLQTEQPKGIVTDEKLRLKSENDDYMNQLQRLGIDPSIIGTDYNQALQNVSSIRGIPTLQAQNQALQAQHQQFNQGMATRQQDMNELNLMTNLTGMLPDGTPTNANQQQQLQNEWSVADRMGTITPTLAEMYGMQPGTPTQQAKQFAMSYGQRERDFQADQDYRQRNEQFQQQQTAFSNGFRTYETTGQMPDYMSQFGIDVQGLNSPKYKEDLQAMYQILADGKSPKDLIKQIDDKIKIGVETEEDGEYMKNAIYQLHPELAPDYVKKPGFFMDAINWLTLNDPQKKFEMQNFKK